MDFEMKALKLIARGIAIICNNCCCSECPFSVEHNPDDSISQCAFSENGKNPLLWFDDFKNEGVNEWS